MHPASTVWVSTAWGAGLAPRSDNSRGRTIAVVGDLAFLHDHNGLLAPATEPRPNLTIVVADNNGGGIFSSLEQGAAEFDADFERVFGTPHDRDLAAVAAAAGSPTVTVTSAAELAAALDDRSVRSHHHHRHHSLARGGTATVGERTA